MEVFDEDNTSDKLIGATQLSLKDFQVRHSSNLLDVRLNLFSPTKGKSMEVGMST